MTKMLSASGGLRPPDPLTRGSVPGPRWGLCPQTPVIGSCPALAMVPPPTTDSFRRLWLHPAAAARVLLSAGRAAINRYLPPAGPTVANPQLRSAAAGWDRRTDVRQLRR